MAHPTFTALAVDICIVKAQPVQCECFRVNWSNCVGASKRKT